MLVSAAIPQSAFPADSPDYSPQQRQEPPLGIQIPAPPARVTFSPISQKSAYIPVSKPRQIAMFRPAYENDLLKSLYGWSSTVEIEITSRISTKSARVGDLVEAKLSQDFRWGPQLIAAKDSLVRGHVTLTQAARTLTRSAISGERRLKSRGLLAIQFDEIIDPNGRRFSVRATPSPRQEHTGKEEHSTKRAIEVDDEGRIVKAETELAGGLKATSNATKVATMVPLPGTVLFTTLAPAVAMGAVGAASPSVAYDKPVDDDIDHRRMKGATYGFLSNLPGAFVVKSVVERGSEVDLLPGDLLTVNVCIKEPATLLPPDEQLSVNGKVLSRGQRGPQRLYPVSPPAHNF